MQKSRRCASKLVKSYQNPAITRFLSKNLPAKGRVFLLKPETGKTHQLRVALKSLSSAIIRDPLYASNSNNLQSVEKTFKALNSKSEPLTKLQERCYLHAWQLSFKFLGTDYHFKDNLPQRALFLTDEFMQIIDQWAEINKIKWSKG